MTALLRRAVQQLALPQLTAAGFATLGAVVLAAQADSRVPGWAVVLPQVILAFNLAAALTTNPLLRRGGLAVFHIALLGCLVLLSWGRLTHFEGRVEVTQGSAFDPSNVEPLSVGLLHGDRLGRINFEQGALEVHYATGLKRARTISQVRLDDDVGQRTESVGDDHPLRTGGFRFYTTHNKGFAPLLIWTAPGSAPVRGAVHLPSYPLFDGQQQQRWTPAGGPEVRLWLRMPTSVDERSAWQLRPDQVTAVLVVEAAGQRYELQPGETASADFGSLRYDRMLGWMGYRIHYDPTLSALWWLSCLGILGLVWHLWPLALRGRLTTTGARSLSSAVKHSRAQGLR